MLRCMRLYLALALLLPSSSVLCGCSGNDSGSMGPIGGSSGAGGSSSGGAGGKGSGGSDGSMHPPVGACDDLPEPGTWQDITPPGS